MSSPLRVLAYERTDKRDLSIDWLREQGADVVFPDCLADPNFQRYTNAQIIAEGQGFQAMLGASSAIFDRDVIAALPALRYISKLGIGVDNIDIAAATEHGVLVTNTVEQAGITAVAEHAIAMMLALRKRLLIWTTVYLRNGRWRGSHYAGTIDGSTIGLIGYGRIGRAVAQRLAGWNVTVLVYDPYLSAAPEGVSLVDLPDLLIRSDIVSLHCEANADNRHLIDAAALGLMQPSALLINTARGSLVDLRALHDALASGRLAGAGLDVFEQEPPDPADPLLRLPNVVATPHVAVRTLEVFLDRRWRAARNLWAMHSGEGTPSIVNPEVLQTSGKGS